MELKVIAYARNGHTDKFGIPRQSREESPILTRIVFEPEYNVAEALRGIEGFSHLWIVWGFSETCRVSQSAEAARPLQDDDKTAEVTAVLTWSPTVRPPRLGGNKRMGVFATRSPFRPNPIGLSSVKLMAVVYPGKATNRDFDTSKFEHGFDMKEGRMELIVSGADMMDGTPIYDIKPYLSFSDSHPDAKNGFAEETKNYRLEVDWGKFATDYLPKTDRCRTDIGPIPDRQWMKEVEYILSQDPRPAYQDDPAREYKMDYNGWRVVFSVHSKSQVYIHSIYKIG